MRPITSRFATAAVLLLTASALAQSPLAGTWKFNQEKSKITGDTMHFAPAPGDAVKFTSGGMSYTFKLDGSDTTTSMGNTAQWTKVDDNTWQAVLKKGSTLLSTDTLKLSADGKTLEYTAQGTKPNGDSFNDTSTYARTSGTKGFLGSWRNTKTTLSSPTGYEIKDNGDGSLTWALPDLKATVTLKTDGTEATPTGPTVPDGLTLSLTKTGPRNFTLIEKLKGKPIYKGKQTVSADGKTLTEEGSSVGVNEPTTAVYDKVG
ncbi:hypothetical protein [Alloacidobacterium sp.]|uniref:hypothetical protein n=1 Tax=Alloacidobacterium sp. TaxID=2951999 RepID=UPI002D6EF6A7|nr:hypothetical protein [Alloacidobacterium sp.]HYK36882.1 hypothetical protein [Alloacidobacterium sp.]